MGGLDQLQFLVASPARRAVLEHLSETEPVTATQLESVVDFSRRTITRALTAFERRGYVQSAPEGYRLTAFGAYLLKEFTTAKAAISTADRLAEVLSRIDADELDVPLAAFESAAVIEPEPTNPYAVIDRLLELRARASEVRMAVHILSQQTVTQLLERASDPDFRGELLLSPDYVTAAANHGGGIDVRLEDLAAAEGITVYVAGETIPYMVGTIDETVTVGVREDRTAVAMLETEAEGARDWATSKLAAVQTAASEYTP